MDLRPPVWHLNFPRLPGLFTSALWPFGLFSMQVDAPVSRLNSIKSALLKPDAAIPDPLGLAASLLSLRDQVLPDEWSEVDALAITRLAGDAQRIVDRYGMDSFLPGDPLRITPVDARNAAQEFEAALKLAPSGEKYLLFRQSLEVREYLCAGLAGQIPDIAPLLRAHDSPAIIPEVHNAIGIHYLESQPKDYDVAIREFQEAKRASPGWMYARHNLALAYIENGDYTAAEREYRDAIATDPLQPYLYYNLGLLLHRMNRRASAKTAYQNAWDNYGMTVARLRVRAAEWKDDLPKESALAARRADVYEKSRAEVLNARGALFAGGREYKSAREDYRHALTIDPDLCPARNNLAALEQTLAERKNKSSVSSEALQDLTENLNHAACANFFPSLLMRARLEVRRKAPTEARADYARVSELVPSNAEALSGMAELDIENGQFESAVKLLNQAIAIQTASAGVAFPSLYVELAEVYRQAGDSEGCRQAYSLAIKASDGTIGDLSKRELRKRATCTEVIKRGLKQ
jgi:tetratricopeptide (TPR) repeat protein